MLILPPQTWPASRVGGVRREIVIDGWRFELEIESAARAALRERARRGRSEAASSGATEVHAIIPGVVVGVSVAAGDDVVAGQQLLAVEAMKMQNELRAPRDGTIERVAVGVGQTIEVGDLLLVLH
jgi:biotin carboxyl carrier protein